MAMGVTIKLAAVGCRRVHRARRAWLGLLTNNFFCRELAPIVGLADGGIARNRPAAFVVYALR